MSPPSPRLNGRLPILPAKVAVAVAALLLGLGLVGATGISIEKDVTALLPGRNSGPDSLVGLARQWGMIRKVAIVIGPTEPGSDRLFAAADAVAGALSRLDGVAMVTSRVDMAEAQRAAEVALSRAARLVRPGSVPKGPGEIAGRLAELKKRLASPEAMVIGQYLLRDPIGFGRDALKGLEAMGEAQGARVERGRLVSLDRRYALVFLDLSFDPLDVERAGAFVDRLDGAIRGAMAKAGVADLGITALGGVHFAAASARAIIYDLAWTSIGIVALVSATFMLFFRRLRLLFMALAPGFLGNAVAVGVMGFAHLRVHALTLGFASTITGISIDYAIHLFHRALGERSGSTRERMISALHAVARPVILGCATAVAAFMLVATSDFTSVRQLAFFAAISLVVSLLATLLLMPSFHRLVLGGEGPGLRDVVERWSTRFMRLFGEGTSQVRRWAVIAAFAALALGSLYGASSVVLSGDPRDLSYTPPALAAAQGRLAQLFPGVTDQVLLVAGAGTRDGALVANDRLYEALRKAGVKPTDVVSVSPFLPSRSTQDKALEASSLVLGGAASHFAAAGFAPSYFEGLKAMLDAPPIAAEDYDRTSLGRIVSDAVRVWNGRWYVLTRVKGSAGLDALARVAAQVPGCRILSERLEARATLSMLQREIAWMLGIWGAVALAMLVVTERSVWFGLRALLPPVFGVLVAVGLFGIFGRPLTPVASAGLTMVLGLGINYGIYVEHEPLTERGRVAAAVLADAITTIVGFGVIALARNRAMADIGIITVTGLTAAMLAALAVLPALPGRRCP
ncbi:MAG: MMPL family transporter [Deltaproteobacteria bacterium]|nr:MMPL family transporter [Deltaproteobacteria bacterium]